MGLAIMVPGVSFAGGNLGKVTLIDGVPVTSLYINDGVVVAPNIIDFSVTVSPPNATDKRVLWSITSGTDYAIINRTSGRLTVQSGASSSTVVIRATSVITPSQYSEKTITVSYEEPQYDLYYYKSRLSGTVSDMQTESDLHLHSDSNTNWTLFAYVSPLSVSPTNGHEVTMLAANNMSSNPYDGLSIVSISPNDGSASKQLYPMIKDENSLRNSVDLATGSAIHQTSVPIMTQDNLPHAFAISRSGNVYKYSMDGVTWENLATYNPSTDAKSAIVSIAGVTLSGKPQRFPTSTSPCEIALVLGQSEHPFIELFAKY